MRLLLPFLLGCGTAIGDTSAPERAPQVLYVTAPDGHAGCTELDTPESCCPTDWYMAGLREEDHGVSVVCVQNVPRASRVLYVSGDLRGACVDEDEGIDASCCPAGWYYVGIRHDATGDSSAVCVWE
jgi:hypothetical protein